MTAKVLLVAVLLCFCIVGVMACFPGKAHAQNPDQELAQKKGIEGLFSGKGVKADDPRLAKPWQKYLAWGSCVVMIIVVKYL